MSILTIEPIRMIEETNDHNTAMGKINKMTHTGLKLQQKSTYIRKQNIIFKNQNNAGFDLTTVKCILKKFSRDHM